jgi:acetyl esterase/lipase
MKKELTIKPVQEVISMASGISYSCVTDWYESTFRNLKMNLIFPKHREGHAKQPAILWLCGGSFSVVNEDVWLPEMMDFAREGYTIASIEYRTSNQATFPAALVDAKSAVRFLKAHAEQFCIDPDHIFVMGESAGGTLASLVGVTENVEEFEQGDNLSISSSVAGVIDFYGLTDLSIIDLGRNGVVPYWTLEAFLGVNYGQDIAKKASAVNYINHDVPPFLILHGDEDQVVPLQQSEILYNELQKNNVEASFYIVRGAGHGEDQFYQPELKDLINQFIKRVVNKKVR